jgi:hypothetical protein
VAAEQPPQLTPGNDSDGALFQAGDFFLDAQLLPLEIGNPQVVGMWAMDFFLDGCFEIRVFLLQLLDMRIEIHPHSSALHRARGQPWSKTTAAGLLQHKDNPKSAILLGYAARRLDAGARFG